MEIFIQSDGINFAKGKELKEPEEKLTPHQASFKLSTFGMGVPAHYPIISMFPVW
jgi:hypothetical protein